MPDFHFERKMAVETGPHIVGVDEAGRGSWSGPVVTAAVFFPTQTLDWVTSLDDSKKLSARKRSILSYHIRKDTLWSISAASCREIDHINILQASLLAMRRALSRLSITPHGVLIDGTIDPQYPAPTLLIPKGDSLSYSIAAASILAKTLRDSIMQKLAIHYPYYGWEKNAGYGVLQHRLGLEKHGISKHHRLSFKPIKNIKS